MESREKARRVAGQRAPTTPRAASTARGRHHRLGASVHLDEEGAGPGPGRGPAGAGPSLSSGRVPRNAAFGSYPVHIPAREECEQGVHYAP